VKKNRELAELGNLPIRDLLSKKGKNSPEQLE
jgi:hypothetical protein